MCVCVYMYLCGATHYSSGTQQPTQHTHPHLSLVMDVEEAVIDATGIPNCVEMQEVVHDLLADIRQLYDRVVHLGNTHAVTEENAASSLVALGGTVRHLDASLQQNPLPAPVDHGWWWSTLSPDSRQDVLQLFADAEVVSSGLTRHSSVERIVRTRYALTREQFQWIRRKRALPGQRRGRPVGSKNRRPLSVSRRGLAT